MTTCPDPCRLKTGTNVAVPCTTPEQVDLGDPPPLVEGRDVEPATARDAGVVDQHVESAPALLDRGPRGDPVRGRGDVEHQVDVTGDPVGGQHLVATLAEPVDQGRPESARGAGDQDSAHGADPSRAAQPGRSKTSRVLVAVATTAPEASVTTPSVNATREPAFTTVPTAVRVPLVARTGLR